MKYLRKFFDAEIFQYLLEVFIPDAVDFILDLIFKNFDLICLFCGTLILFLITFEMLPLLLKALGYLALGVIGAYGKSYNHRREIALEKRLEKLQYEAVRKALTLSVPDQKEEGRGQAKETMEGTLIKALSLFGYSVKFNEVKKTGNLTRYIFSSSSPIKVTNALVSTVQTSLKLAKPPIISQQGQTVDIGISN
ncbi:hypothetical protein HC928_04180 [bacterium]|nr:hypothetical protein [bacterium]